MLDLPPEWESTFKKALAWEPRVYTCTWPVKKSIQAVANSLKPVACHYPNQIVKQQVQKHRLRSISITEDDCIVDRYIFKSANEDIALLARANFVDLPFDRARYYFIFGICLGYPIPLVIDFCNKHSHNSKYMNEIRLME